VAMPSQPIRLRILNALARLFGVCALLVGGYGVWCGLTLREDRWLNLGLGGFTFVIGCAFLVTKPVTRAHLDQVFGGFHKDSTDKRGPDEWQAEGTPRTRWPSAVRPDGRPFGSAWAPFGPESWTRLGHSPWQRRPQITEQNRTGQPARQRRRCVPGVDAPVRANLAGAPVDEHDDP
jgi:hypothetical protein